MISSLRYYHWSLFWPLYTLYLANCGHNFFSFLFYTIAQLSIHCDGVFCSFIKSLDKHLDATFLLTIHFIPFSTPLRPHSFIYNSFRHREVCASQLCVTFFLNFIFLLSGQTVCIKKVQFDLKLERWPTSPAKTRL